MSCSSWAWYLRPSQLFIVTEKILIYVTWTFPKPGLKALGVP